MASRERKPPLAPKVAEKVKHYQELQELRRRESLAWRRPSNPPPPPPDKSKTDPRCITPQNQSGDGDLITFDPSPPPAPKKVKGVGVCNPRYLPSPKERKAASPAQTEDAALFTPPNSVSEDNSVLPPLVVEKRPRKRVEKAGVIFCCDDDGVEKAPLKLPLDPPEPKFADFVHAAEVGIMNTEHSVGRYRQYIDHLIVLTSEIPRGAPRSCRVSETRYFFYNHRYVRYQEIPRGHIDWLVQNKTIDEDKPAAEAGYSCFQHKHWYTLKKYECVVIQGAGLKKALSAQQISQEKRSIMIRKVSQGRANEIEQFRNMLEKADAQALAAISRRVEGSADEIIKVARKVSSGKHTGEGIDLQLARLSLQYSESRVA